MTSNEKPRAVAAQRRLHLSQSILSVRVSGSVCHRMALLHVLQCLSNKSSNDIQVNASQVEKIKHQQMQPRHWSKADTAAISQHMQLVMYLFHRSPYVSWTVCLQKTLANLSCRATGRTIKILRLLGKVSSTSSKISVLG